MRDVRHWQDKHRELIYGEAVCKAFEQKNASIKVGSTSVSKRKPGNNVP
jgi:hypothetical protein